MTMRRDSAPSPYPIASVPLTIGIVMLAALTEATLDLFSIPFLQTATLYGQAALLLGGAAAVAWGVSGWRPQVRAWRRPRLALTPLEAIALVGIIVLAIGLRLHDSERALPVLIDEFNFLSALGRASDDRLLRLLQPMSAWAPYTWLYTVVQVVYADLFGHTLTAVRGASLLLGVAQVVVLYPLTRTLFNRRLALLAILALACFAPHLHYSRTAYSPHPGDTLFGMLTLLFAARALGGRRPLDWALAGACLGLTQYWYEAGRLFFPALIGGWLLLRVVLRTDSIGVIGGGAVRLLGAALLVSAPIYVVLTARDHTLTYRFDSENILAEFWGARLSDGLDADDWNAIGQRLALPFLFYAVQPETPGVPYYQGDEPLILRAFVPLLLIGVVMLAVRPRAPGGVVLLWIVGVALANGLLIRNPMVSTRYGLVAPALALTIALGAVGVGQCVRWLMRRPTQRVASGVALAVIGVFAVVNVGYYFEPLLADLRAEARAFVRQRDLFDVGLRGARLPDGVQVVVLDYTVPDLPDVDELLSFLTYRAHRTPWSMIPFDLHVRDFPADRAYAFFVNATDRDSLLHLYDRFPGAKPLAYSTTEMPPDESYVLVYVPRPGTSTARDADRFATTPTPFAAP